MKGNIFPKSTTGAFHIAFLHITMYSYMLQYRRQLDNSIRHRSNNASCTLYRKDFHFWLRYKFFSELTWHIEKPVAANNKAVTIKTVLISYMSD